MKPNPGVAKTLALNAHLTVVAWRVNHPLESHPVRPPLGAPDDRQLPLLSCRQRHRTLLSRLDGALGPFAPCAFGLLGLLPLQEVTKKEISPEHPHRERETAG